MRRLQGLLLLLAAISVEARLSSASSKDWRRVISAHFIGVGNASAPQLRDAVADVEQLRTALTGLFPSLSFQSERIMLVLLKNQAELDKLLWVDERHHPITVGGYYTRTPLGNYFVLPVTTAGQTREVAYHEYVHDVLVRNLPQAPVWAYEGIADFYSTLEIDRRKGSVTIGRIPPDRAFGLSHFAHVPLRCMVSDGAGSGCDNTGVSYETAWAFVDFLAFSNHGKRNGQLATYLTLMAGGRAPDVAFADAFGGSYDELDRELRGYLAGNNAPLREDFPAVQLTLPRGGPAGQQIDETPLSVADAEALQARILLDNQRLKDAQPHVSAALRDEPHHVDARVALGRLRTQEERFDDAVAALRELPTDSPDNFAVQYQLGATLLHAGHAEEAIQPLSKATELRPDSAFAWFELSVCTLAVRRDAQADAALAHVLRLESEPDWIRGRALRAFGLGRFDIVAADVDRFRQYPGTAAEARTYMAFLGAVSLRRDNRREEADALLTEAAKGVKHGDWTESVLMFLQGRLGEASFLSHARDISQQTEARTYIGLAKLQAGDGAAARAHFEWVRDHGSHSSVEYELALHELHRKPLAAS
jgi:tetratricopeptide (TPR) repeat protein